MKTLLSLFFLVPSLSFGQADDTYPPETSSRKSSRKGSVYTLGDMPFKIDSITRGVVFRGLVEVPGITPDQLYIRAKSFLAKVFSNGTEGLQVDDKEGGLLVVKGYMGIPMGLECDFQNRNFAYYIVPINLQFKDGMYHYEIANIQLFSRGRTTNWDDYIIKTATYNEKQYQRTFTTCQRFVYLIKDLEVAMKQPVIKDN